MFSDVETRANPYRSYRRIRELAPIHQSDGRALQRRLIENRLRILNDAVSDFSTDEVASLVDLTERFLTNLDSVVREHTETGSRRSGRSIETGDL